ncbi:hypothetical protein BD779DRAFT_497680 [Infundibulicybe gibba]|nr:hypothetical protein BD779DRAFT_497680 [Infundibulicybe gibba]
MRLFSVQSIGLSTLFCLSSYASTGLIYLREGKLIRKYPFLHSNGLPPRPISASAGDHAGRVETCVDTVSRQTSGLRNGS